MYCKNTVLSFVMLVLTLAGHALTAPASASADGALAKELGGGGPCSAPSTIGKRNHEEANIAPSGRGDLGCSVNGNW
ncbi:hypothetical protein PCANC_05843 [Puccinia coronata f. sp. avenae]|uniref:Uncharacterized protein n=1 Tax=Puccinia coronata f. sp. avenae TaxID=200324 RepID=A0A2N5VBM1_9BASI|nr:hypothetical protein PCANC_05843 [Puccinia coronata f. sp. avenae]